MWHCAGPTVGSLRVKFNSGCRIPFPLSTNHKTGIHIGMWFHSNAKGREKDITLEESSNSRQ